MLNSLSAGVFVVDSWSDGCARQHATCRWERALKNCCIPDSPKLPSCHPRICTASIASSQVNYSASRCCSSSPGLMGGCRRAPAPGSRSSCSPGTLIHTVGRSFPYLYIYIYMRTVTWLSRRVARPEAAVDELVDVAESTKGGRNLCGGDVGGD